jgi:nucleoside-diphosphate kinase
LNKKTLAIIKPDVVRDNKIGEVIAMITQAGFKIKAMKMVRLRPAEGFMRSTKKDLSLANL